MNDDQYLGQIMLIAGNFAPRGYVECNGQLLSIRQHDALFKLIKTTYGGDGITTFRVPDLRGRLVCGIGKRDQGGEIRLGENIGTEKTLVKLENMPAHRHTANVSIRLKVSGSDDQDSDSPIGNFLRLQNEDTYATTADATMGNIIGIVEMGMQTTKQEPMDNIMPVLPMMYCMSLEGPEPRPE
ncbi:phage tail protein [Flavobacterium pallidum]|uniref:Phage tail protein n=1 Tax=Flavobacterium pallidum TaxID=2172098 RepID=A0A2S1SFX4_9FLAO|nr:tail fiber protein [Flavobacterium pallidum]AWI25252.1 phage tail protein [Flavobacterium pallidum]